MRDASPREPMLSSIGCREEDSSGVELPAAFIVIMPGVQKTSLYYHVKPCNDRPPPSGQAAVAGEGAIRCHTIPTSRPAEPSAKTPQLGRNERDSHSPSSSS